MGPGEAGAQAARALTLAGLALDPNAPEGPSAALARPLLREALVMAARLRCDDAAVASVDHAARALGARGEAPPADVLNALHPDAGDVDDVDALRRAEREIALLLERARGGRSLLGRRRRAVWIPLLLVLAVAAALTGAERALARPWEEYRWTSSSAWGTFAQSGTLGGHDPEHDLVLHTDEEVDPWVVVDLLAVRTVRRVTVINRADCCRERGLPLSLELAGPDGNFAPVAARDAPFEVWDVPLASRSARYLRLRAAGRTYLQLREIQVR